jgi:hypothetical protein
MGVDVELYRHEQRGSSPRRAVNHLQASLLTHDVLDGLLDRVHGHGSTPMLDRIDPVKDLVLTSQEMPQLLAELAHLASHARTPAEAKIVQELTALAARCRDNRDLQLHFVGD